MRRRILFSIAMAVLLTLGGSAIFAQDEAPLLSNAENTYIYVDNKYSLATRLTDNNWTTKYELPAGSEIVVEASEDIYSLYIIWDAPPAPYTIECDMGAHLYGDSGGENGFLHEYIELYMPTDRIAIHVPQGGVTICDIFAYGDGETPARAQIWEPACEDADMLLLSTHADDEHLFFGGTMPTYAGERGYKLQVAYLNHHREQPYRQHELLKGLYTVGIRNYPVIAEFADTYSESLEHAKKIWDLNEVEAFEVMLLRRFKPEVVITHDINGEYGHGGHMLGAWVMQQAIEWAADPEWKAEGSGEYAQQANSLPLHAIKKMYMHLWPEGAVIMNWDVPLEKFDGKTALDMAKEGYACHASQQKWFQVRTDGVFDCRAFGLYYSAVGADSGEGDPDFFENITESDFSDYIPPQPEPVEEPAPIEPQVQEPPIEAEPDRSWGFLEDYGIFIIALAIIAAIGFLAALIRRLFRRKGKH